ncbi:hypothetical protein [Candidatus Vidania fulgoroideorum]
MKILPINKWILLKKVEERSILISKKKSNQGDIISICKSVKTKLTRGDRVCYKKFSSQKFNQRYVFIKYKHIIAKITEDKK